MDAAPTTRADWIDVPPTNVLTLAANAVAHTRYPWLDFRDPLAEHVWQRLGACAGQLSDRALRAALGRTLLLDKLARRWAQRRRGGRIIEVGSGLSTRHARLTELVSPLLAIDEAPLARIRREVFPAPHAFTQVAAPLEERHWVREAAASRGALFVLVEDAFLDLRSSDVLATLTSLAAEMPCGSLLAASFGPRARFVVAHPSARRATLEVQVEHACGAQEIVRFPRFTWRGPPSPLDGEQLSAVALLEAT
jgi:O-methyltransferase involved in polyketide biosynthesis